MKARALVAGGTLLALLVLIQGRVVRDLRPGEVSSDQLQGLHFKDLDDNFDKGPIGPQGQFSKAPPPSAYGRSKTPGKVISSDQLLGAKAMSGDPFESGWGQHSSPPSARKPPPPPPTEDPLLAMQQLNNRLLSPEAYELQYPPSQGDLNMLGKISTDPSGKEHLSTYQGATKHIKLETRKVSAYKASFNDPLWSNQWYLQDYRTVEGPVMDLNVVPVWNMGITGKGVYVAVVDDGVTHGHPDLHPNPDEQLSFDYKRGVAGSQPDPPEESDTMMHGTQCAGVIAMVPDNGVCGVGIAHGATIVGVKIMGGSSEGRPANSFEDGKGLVHKKEVVDISSNSYGTKDDGKSSQFITNTKNQFIEMGLKQGRGGKGTIYMVASGNGRHNGDVCGADAVVNHVGMIAISSATYLGKVTYYGEGCSAVFAATYSEGLIAVDVSTTDINGGCTSSFSGTSAATPAAAAVVALVLEAAKRKGTVLSYRDVMHIISMGAEVAPLADNNFRDERISAWTRNGAGFWVSNDFGFGLLNAKNMVRLAQEWQNVPEMHSCEIAVPLDVPLIASAGKPATIEFQVRGCKVRWLESVQLIATVEAGYRGAIEITLTSPAGTKAYVMESRRSDSSAEAMQDWTFKSVHTWGENPQGTWTIQVISFQEYGIPDTVALANGFQLIAHGLTGPPPHQRKLPRTYSAFRLVDGKTSH